MRYILLLFFIAACNSGEKSGLVWEEDFNGETLDASKWSYQLGDGCPELCGWGNNEPQIYTTNNHELRDGKLYITVRKEDSIYTSTRITTKDKFEFKYGRVEARAKIPTGKGVWPAFWMLGANIDEVGWPLSGEIDILEYVGKEPGIIFTSLHTQDSHGNTIHTRKTKIDGIEEGFHVYVADWSPEKIEFFVDGKSVYTFSPGERSQEVWPFDQPFYLLLNVAVGGNFGGPEIDDSIFPQQFVVDYIRVYKP
ncbi:glycoside hydrolase family 16 protein [Zeaxanthinibacter enoshimensis]|uniref:Glycosyl hydrolase family 16 n=1 Tax=Zeaxanthinibacter enoshimensis TaxID=392009 RepID=A0A4R6TK27_9FLAO|nr:glycoside hydrolase family 16 protein [Zeaxanthinibacter enoshimensis]TDQ29142.1 glycosyl hydrolase family 16 [Zeaxanthinibacter enoshimensis]